MTDLDDLYDLIARAQAAPWGPGCSALWAQAARLAEDLGRDEDALECYSNLVTAYTMGGEATRVIAPFTWCDNMYRTSRPLYRCAQALLRLAVQVRHYGAASGAYRSCAEMQRCSPANAGTLPEFG